MNTEEAIDGLKHMADDHPCCAAFIRGVIEILETAPDPPVRCNKCGTEMHEGVALISTFTGEPDDLGGEIVTLNWGGPGQLVECLKCPSCGHSETKIQK